MYAKLMTLIVNKPLNRRRYSDLEAYQLRPGGFLQCHLAQRRPDHLHQSIVHQPFSCYIQWRGPQKMGFAPDTEDEEHEMGWAGDYPSSVFCSEVQLKSPFSLARQNLSRKCEPV